MSAVIDTLRRNARHASESALELMSPKAAYQLGYAAGLQEAADRIASDELSARLRSGIIRKEPSTDGPDGDAK